MCSKTRSQVLQRFRFTDDVLAAAIHADRVYLFNDKVGYFMDAASGQTVHTSVESENYRGLFLLNGVASALRALAARASCRLASRRSRVLALGGH
jgi:hypothetical protein